MHSSPLFLCLHRLCFSTHNGSRCGTGLWNLPCSYNQLLGLCHSVSAHGQIKQISRMDSSMSGFTSWIPGELPLPPWLKLLTAAGVSGQCNIALLSAASSCPRVSRCPSATGMFSSVSWDCILLASLHLTLLCLSLSSLHWFCSL